MRGSLDVSLDVSLDGPAHPNIKVNKIPETHRIFSHFFIGPIPFFYGFIMPESYGLINGS
jgi:hypothetical protein